MTPLPPQFPSDFENIFLINSEINQFLKTGIFLKIKSHIIIIIIIEK